MPPGSTRFVHEPRRERLPEGADRNGYQFPGPGPGHGPGPGCPPGESFSGKLGLFLSLEIVLDLSMSQLFWRSGKTPRMRPADRNPWSDSPRKRLSGRTGMSRLNRLHPARPASPGIPSIPHPELPSFFPGPRPGWPRVDGPPAAGFGRLRVPGCGRVAARHRQFHGSNNSGSHA
jgi:hypothetical protein